ncbi:CPBP family intramembrane metalloprotease [Acidothermaceae bacterium B102]|nr:CPBP family intramembrane metalloprotease [Acidothermaceae bacterium B102]
MTRDRLTTLLAPALLEQVPRDHTQPLRGFHRRRVVAAVALVIGSTLLGFALSVRPGASSFYAWTMGVAAAWVVGGVLSGPLHLGYIPFRGKLRRPIVTPVLIGVACGAIFIAGSLVVREIGPARDFIVNVLAHARRGSMTLVAVVTVANGIAEEIFFRGAVYAAIGRRHAVVISTLIYTAATVATGNPTLVFAAATLGLVLALQRRASGGILAPILTHVTWSLMMLFTLPLIFPG